MEHSRRVKGDLGIKRVGSSPLLYAEFYDPNSLFLEATVWLVYLYSEDEAMRTGGRFRKFREDEFDNKISIRYDQWEYNNEQIKQHLVFLYDVEGYWNFEIFHDELESSLEIDYHFENDSDAVLFKMKYG